MVSAALRMALVWGAAAGAPPFLGSFLGQGRADVVAAMSDCRVDAEGPVRLSCPLDRLGAARRAIFLLDDSQRVLSIMVIYSPQASLVAAEQAARPLLQAMAQQRGAPQVKKTDVGREWVFSRSSFVGLVRIARRGAGWQVQTLLSDPTYTPHILHHPAPSAR